MREHQIVITLKPDQFLEVQRMARAANAKSMGIFVRQKLLAALGIEGTGVTTTGQEHDPQNVEAALGQVRRLHGELKTFVAESLSLYNFDSETSAASAAVSVTAAAPASPSSDALEQVAEKTFAISPRLGSMGEGPSRISPAAAAAEGAASEPAAETHSKHEAHKREREQHRYHQHAASDLLDVPFKGGGGANADVRPAPGTPVINDPLEKLLPKQDARNAAPVQPAAPAVPQQPSGTPPFNMNMPAGAPAQYQAAPAPDSYQVQSAGSYQAPQGMPESNQPATPASFYFMDEPAVPQSLSDALEAAVAGNTENAELFGSVDELESMDGPSEPPVPQAPAVPPTQTQGDKSIPGQRKSIDQPSFSGSPPPKRRRV